MSTTADVLRALSDGVARLPDWTLARLNLAADADATEAARQAVARFVAAVKAADTPQLRAGLARYPKAAELFVRLREAAAMFGPMGTAGPFTADVRRFFADWATGERQALADLSGELFLAADVLDLLPPAAVATAAAGRSGPGMPVDLDEPGAWAPLSALNGGCKEWVSKSGQRGVIGRWRRPGDRTWLYNMRDAVRLKRDFIKCKDRKPWKVTPATN
jgi:hypothetical protein